MIELDLAKKNTHTHIFGTTQNTIPCAAKTSYPVYLMLFARQQLLSNNLLIACLAKE